MRNTILSCFLLLTSFGSYSQSNLPALYKKSLPSIVKVSCLTHAGVMSEGTGFFIDKEGIVITCYHVVENTYTMYIETQSGKRFYPDSVLASNKKNDLIKFSVIKYKNDTITPLALSKKLPEVGESVFTIGNPDDFDFSMSSGIVSAIRQTITGETIQNTAPCSPGSSGSPLMNMKGEVVGVLTFVKFSGQNLNFATSSKEIINFKDDNTIQTLHAEMASIKTRELDSLIKLAESELGKNNYERVIELALPLTKFVKGEQALKLTELISNAYFLKQDYPKANTFFEHIIKSLSEKNPHTPDDLVRFSFALQKQGICYYFMGAKQESLDLLEKSIDVSKQGFENDSIGKAIHKMILQTGYYYHAQFNFQMGNLANACMSWKLAKEWGTKLTDNALDKACK